MIPIEDENPTYRVPWVVYSLITLNLLAFVVLAYLSQRIEFSDLLKEFALLPDAVLQGKMVYTLITSMFLHINFFHIFGNLIFLYIFGNNIEDFLGRKRFILFYFACGITGSVLQILLYGQRDVPIVGASGAIAGVLGAYLYVYPRATVKSVLLIGYPFNLIYHFLAGLARIPAYFLITFWFMLQVFPGYLLTQGTYVVDIAYFSHIGGFLAGILFIKLMPVDRSLARRKQRLYEGVCAIKSEMVRSSERGILKFWERQIKEEDNEEDIKRIHLFLNFLADVKKLELTEASKAVGVSVEYLLSYLPCLMDDGYVRVRQTKKELMLYATEKCVEEYA